MSKQMIERKQPVSERLHPRVYQGMVALVTFYVLSVWLLFHDGSHNALVYTVVTGLFVVAIAIPLALWGTWYRNCDADEPLPSGGFRDWACREFDTCTGRARGSHAAVEALLPIAAVAVGMAVLGLLFFLTEQGFA
jgi:amino acid transporter